MKPSNVVIWLSLLIALLAAVAAGAGLFWQDGGGPFSFTTVRGETVQMYGQGLYRYDTLFLGAGNTGVDAVTLFLAVPFIVLATLFYRRGSLRAALLLTGMLVYFLYVYASMALGVAYNAFFLVYVVLFSASFYTFVFLFASIDRQALALHFLPGLPRQAPAYFMFAAGLVTFIVWGGTLIADLIQNRAPELLDSYTTPVTFALDLAIITPATFLSGALILKRAPLGYLIAFPLLVLIIMLAPQIALSTTLQVSAGISFEPAQIVGPMAGFAVLGLLAIWILVALLRNISESAQQKRNPAGWRKR